jgi:hypothetical protein
MAFAEFLAGLVVFSVVVMYVKARYQEAEYVTSEVDGRAYLVQKARDSGKAADMLARMNQRAQSLVDAMKRDHASDGRTERLVERYDPDAVSEGGEEAGYTSYSINKGEKIVLCLRARGTGDVSPGKIEDINTLMYVFLHELAHLATEEVGHTPPFWDNFRFILDVAEAEGLYSKVDYKQTPTDYCGIKITSSAAFAK